MASFCFALSTSPRADHDLVLKPVRTCFTTAHVIFGLGEYWEALPSSGALGFAFLFWASPNKPFHIARWYARKHDGYSQRADAHEA